MRRGAASEDDQNKEEKRCRPRERTGKKASRCESPEKEAAAPCAPNYPLHLRSDSMPWNPSVPSADSFHQKEVIRVTKYPLHARIVATGRSFFSLRNRLLDAWNLVTEDTGFSIHVCAWSFDAKMNFLEFLFLWISVLQIFELKLPKRRNWPWLT